MSVCSLFEGGEGGYPISVNGKIFDTRFGLIHVQTGKKKFLLRDPPAGIARNCYGYAAGGMPLAFTQEDFLVSFFICDIHSGGSRVFQRRGIQPQGHQHTI